MIFGDLETTGLLVPDANDLRNQPYITEMYFVKLDFNEDGSFKFIDEIETLVKPPIPISEEITQITGITNEMLYDKPSFPAIHNRLTSFFLGEEFFIAHNVAFEIGVIRCELARMGMETRFPWPPNQICTVERSLPIHNKRLSLGKLHEYLTGSPHENAHRARADVEALVRCYSGLMELGLV
jgi:DNA polymerase III subunit alpha, Gram-positive type